MTLVTSEADSMEHFVHFLCWHLGQGAELVEHVCCTGCDWFVAPLGLKERCLIQAERTPLRTGHSHCLIDIYRYIYRYIYVPKKTANVSLKF